MAFPAVPAFSLKLLLSKDLLFSTAGISFLVLFFFIFLTLGPLAYFKNLFSIVFNKKTSFIFSTTNKFKVSKPQYIYYISSSLSNNHKITISLIVNLLIWIQLVLPKVLLAFF